MARGVSPVRSRGIAGAGVILLALGGACAVGPNYQRPPIDTPGGFRGKTATSTGSLADLPWWKLFRDENLQGLIRTALAGNYDLRIAVSRVEQAREFAAQARGVLSASRLRGRGSKGQERHCTQPSCTHGHGGQHLCS